MIFTKRLRDGVRRGEITCSVRIWTRPHVKVGNRYSMEEGKIEVDSVLPIRLADISPDLARESGFKGVVDLLKIAKHGKGANVYLVRFHYVRPSTTFGTPREATRRRQVRERYSASMTFDGFRRLALSMPEAIEVGHMGHPDFRVRGKIFATLGYPDADWGMVKLTPEQQEAFVSAEPAVFVPIKGAWGRRGATNVRLRSAKVRSLRVALAASWRNVAPPDLAHGRTSQSPNRRDAVGRRKTTA